MITNLFVPTENRVPQFLQWWSRIQEQGKMSFILKNGLAFIAGFLPLFIGLQVAYNVAINNQSWQQSVAQWTDISVAGLLVGIMAVLIGGWAFGWGMWQYNQRVYRILLQRQQQH